MNKKKWAKEKDTTKLLYKLGEEVGEVFKATIDEDYATRSDEVGLAMIDELSHVIFIAYRLMEVIDEQLEHSPSA